MAVHALCISILRNIFYASKKHGFYTVLLNQIFTLSLLLSTKKEFRWSFSRPLILWFRNQLCWLFPQRCNQLHSRFIIHATTPFLIHPIRNPVAKKQIHHFQQLVSENLYSASTHPMQILQILYILHLLSIFSKIHSYVLEG